MTKFKINGLESLKQAITKEENNCRDNLITQNEIDHFLNLCNTFPEKRISVSSCRTSTRKGDEHVPITFIQRNKAGKKWVYSVERKNQRIWKIQDSRVVIGG